jgi:hypothetical protein
MRAAGVPCHNPLKPEKETYKPDALIHESDGQFHAPTGLPLKKKVVTIVSLLRRENFFTLLGM